MDDHFYTLYNSDPEKQKRDYLSTDRIVHKTTYKCCSVEAIDSKYSIIELFKWKIKCNNDVKRNFDWAGHWSSLPVPRQRRAFCKTSVVTVKWSNKSSLPPHKNNNTCSKIYKPFQ